MQSIVQLDMGAGERVPAVLQLPEVAGPVPAALLLHGFTARKEEMSDSIGAALARRGVASLSPDLPSHGERIGGIEGMSLTDPIALVRNWRLALKEAHAAIRYLAEHTAVDSLRVGIVGYSLGAYISSFVASANPRVQAIALVCGGDLPARTPFVSLVRRVADPRRAVRRLAGRPLLMMNGERDRLILPEQARTLFDAAGEPKELRWYKGPHLPPRFVVDDVADWVFNRLAECPSAPFGPPDEPADSSRAQPLRRAS
jgi:fermentation-respiration switch protein FrsA (DUF1100 family)